MTRRSARSLSRMPSLRAFFDEWLELGEAMPAGRRHDVDRELIVDADCVLALLLEERVLSGQFPASTVGQMAQCLDPFRGVAGRRLDDQIEIFGEAIVAMSCDCVAANQCIANAGRIE